MNIKVENLKSENGNSMANQFRIITTKGCFFQSYQTIIAHVKDRTVLDRNFDCSRTTTKYLSIFLNESIQSIRKKVESGEYKLRNLNK